MTERPPKIRDIAPTAVRLHPELRHALAREAAINGRTLHGEIVHRLQQSLTGYAEVERLRAGENLPAASQVELPEFDRRLLTVFRKLSPEKQLALLNLLA